MKRFILWFDRVFVQNTRLIEIIQRIILGVMVIFGLFLIAMSHLYLPWPLLIYMDFIFGFVGIMILITSWRDIISWAKK